MMTTRSRDAGNGQFVTEDYAQDHPETTIHETATITAPDRLSEALDGIEAAGWDWTLYFHREPHKLPVGTHRYELEAWRQPAGTLRLGGATKREAADAVLAAIADLPPMPEPEPADDAPVGDVVPELTPDEEDAG